MKKQENAVVLPKKAKDLCQTNQLTVKEMFKELYLGVVMEVPVEDSAADENDTDDTDADDDDTTYETHIVTVVEYQEKARGIKEGWYVTTDLACEVESCMHSEQKYSSSELGDTQDIRISSGSTKYPGLGTYIKMFNTVEKNHWAMSADG